MHATVQPQPFRPTDFAGYAGVESKAPYIAQLQGAQLGAGFAPGTAVDFVADGEHLQAFVFTPSTGPEGYVQTWYSMQAPLCLDAVQVLVQVQLPLTKACLEKGLQYMGTL